MASVALIEAACRGDEAALQRVLRRRGVRVDGAFADGRSAVHHAASCGHVGVLELLLERGAAADRPDAVWWTPMHFAASNGHAPIVELLLHRQTPPDELNGKGQSPLHLAAKNGHTDVVRLLVAAEGVDVLRRDHHENASTLKLAAGAGHVDIVALLLADGACDAAADPCALHAAVTHNQLGALRQLLAAGADPDAVATDDLRTATTPALVVAVRTSGVGADVVSALLEAGADVDKRALGGFTALHSACEHGKLDVVQRLIAAGASVNAFCEYRTAPLHVAASAGILDCAQALLEAGADVDVALPGGNSPLAHAVQPQMVLRDGRYFEAMRPRAAEMADLLLRAGADLALLPPGVPGYEFAHRRARLFAVPERVCWVMVCRRRGLVGRLERCVGEWL